MPKYQIYCAVCDRMTFIEAPSLKALQVKLSTLDVCPLGTHEKPDNLKEVYRVVGWINDPSMSTEELQALASLHS